MSIGDQHIASTTTTTYSPATSDNLTYYCKPTYYCSGYYTWPIYPAPLTEDDVRRVLREELEDILIDDKALKKATIRALKKRLAELESD